MLVYSAPGLRVRDPITRRHVPKDGLEVDEGSLIWTRLLRDGDVVLTKPEPEPEGPTDAEAGAGDAAKDPGNSGTPNPSSSSEGEQGAHSVDGDNAKESA